MIRLMTSRAFAGPIVLRRKAANPKALAPMDADFRDMLAEVRTGRVPGVGGDVAVVKLDSAIMFEASLWDAFSGSVQATNTVVDAIKAAANDGAVKAVVLELNSPGGSVAGWDEIKNAIAAAKAKKPVYALVHEAAFSMGYRIAAQADKIIATPSSIVGSIGTIVLMYDDSALYAEHGVIAKPVASDEYKAQGWGGVPLTDAYLEHVRTSIVEPDYAEFVAEVAAARNLSKDEVRALGSLEYRASDALSKGLVDAIESADDFIARVAIEAPLSPRPAETDGAGKGVVMDLKTLKDKHPDLVAAIEAEAATAAATELAQQAAKPAGFAELKAEFAEDPGFIVQALEGGLTLSNARKAWADKQSARAKEAELKAAKNDAAQAQREAIEKALPGAGNEAVENAAQSIAAGGDYEKLVQAEKARGLSTIAAHTKVQRENPAAWKAYGAKLKTAMGA